jgi:hypothetical protein
VQGGFAVYVPNDSGWPLVGVRLVIYLATTKATLLLSVPLGVVTSTVPVFAPVGTVAVISVAETTVKLPDSNNNC